MFMSNDEILSKCFVLYQFVCVQCKGEGVGRVWGGCEGGGR